MHVAQQAGCNQPPATPNDADTPMRQSNVCASNTSDRLRFASTLSVDDNVCCLMSLQSIRQASLGIDCAAHIRNARNETKSTGIAVSCAAPRAASTNNIT